MNEKKLFYKTTYILLGLDISMLHYHSAIDQWNKSHLGTDFGDKYYNNTFTTY